VVWAKNANQFPDGTTLPGQAADYYQLVDNIHALWLKIAEQFPSVVAVFNSSRIYGGYVVGDKQLTRGEPLSYEGGYATNAAIARWHEEQADHPMWVGWGPYLWAKGSEIGNASGILWEPGDYESDGIHPGPSGEAKVAAALHAFFMGFDWYAGP
jgi:hypothetical protein